MKTVTLYSAFASHFLSQIVAGLAELAWHEEIELKFAYSSSRELAKPVAFYAIWISIEADGNLQWIFIDTLDNGAAFFHEQLRQCDFYFKRSYLATEVENLPPILRTKVRPMALNFPVTTPAVGLALRCRRAVLGSNYREHPWIGLRRLAASILQDTTIGHRLGMKKPVPTVEDLLGDPNTATYPLVYFRTRLYGESNVSSDSDREKKQQLNESRIRLIETLRSSFGDLAYCGLYETKDSYKLAPHLIKHLPQGYEGLDGHRRFARRCLINVNNIGVSKSNGWKIPEILASAACLVTETISHEATALPVSGVHALTFEDPAGCVEACTQLLNDPDKATALRVAGFEFFQKHLLPRDTARDLLNSVAPV